MYEVDPNQVELRRTAMQIHEILQQTLGASAPDVFIPNKANGKFDVTCDQHQADALLALLRHVPRSLPR